MLSSKLLGYWVLCRPCGCNEEAEDCTHRYTLRKEKKKGKREKERDERVAASFVSISGTTSIADNDFPLLLSSRSHFFP